MGDIMAKNDGQSKLCAFLAYFIIGIVWFFVDKNLRKDKFVALHVSNAISVWIVAIVVNVINMVLFWTVIIPIILGFALMILGLIWLIQMLIYVINGESKYLLFLEPLAKNFKF